MLEFLLTLLYSALFILLIYRMKFFRLEGFSPKILSAVFLLKVLAGTGLYLLYTYYYTDRSTADIYKYYDDSKVLYDALFHKPLDFLQILTGIGNGDPYFHRYYNEMNYWFMERENSIYGDGHVLIRFNAVVRLFSFGCFNVHTVFMSFVSFTGLVALYKFFLPELRDRRKGLFAAVFLVPSLLFWGSGVIKEGLVLFGLGFLLLFFRRLLNEGISFRNVFWLFVSLLLLRYTKNYLYLICVPLLIAYAWIQITGKRMMEVKFLAVILLFAAMGLIYGAVQPEYDIAGILAKKQQDFLVLAQEAKSGSQFYTHPLKPELGSLLAHAPEGFLNVLLRPFPWDSGSPLIFLCSLENLLILIILAGSLYFCKPGRIRSASFYTSLVIVAVTFLLVGLTTPVAGAIVRYRSPALPFLLVMCLMVLDKDKVKAKLKWLKIFG